MLLLHQPPQAPPPPQTGEGGGGLPETKDICLQRPPVRERDGQTEGVGPASGKEGVGQGGWGKRVDEVIERWGGAREWVG